MRTNLKVYRIKKHLTQAEAAKQIGAGRAMYGHIERGFRNGSAEFWAKVKKAYKLSDSELKRLQKNE